MFRLKKLIGILIVLGIVFFIICDEQGYQVAWQDNHIFLKKIEKKPEPKVIDQQIEKKNVVYKNSDLIHLNYEFENPRNLRKSDGFEKVIVYKNSTRIKLYTGFENPITLRNSAGLDEEVLAKIEQQKLRDQELESLKPNIISLNDDTVSSIFHGEETQSDNTETESTEPAIIYKNSTRIKLYTGFENPVFLREGELVDDLENHQNDLQQENSEDNSSIDLDEDKEEPETVDESILDDEEKENIIHDTIGKYIRDDTNDILKEAENQSNIVVEPENKQEQEINIPVEETQKIEESDQEITPIENSEKETVAEIEETKEPEETPQEKETRIHKAIGKYIRNNVVNILREAESVQHDENEEEYTSITEQLNIGPSDKVLDIFNKDEEEIVNTEESQEESQEEIKEEMKEEMKDEEEIIDSEEKETVAEIEETKETVKEPVKEPEETPQEKEIRIHNAIGKYIRNNVTNILRRAESIQPSFVIDETPDNKQEQEIGTSNDVLEKLLANEEIDIDTLESENDEFLLKIFQQTKDEEVMNLIVENYLNEYQFIKAKKFIENLSEQYRDKLKPSLNLRVAFNSFALTSKNIDEPLKLLVQDYLTKGEISNEDANRYLGVIDLMNHNYDDYFPKASGFTSEKYTTFTSKLQGYKDQIAKQMGMPDYYFDTLVSLELFNQGLFQPAKVVALSSLQYNSNYILPYQVLAYANFLTNSRDTSNEYFKKLIDLDPNNAEKYRFLMGVAYYRNEQYEQSVVMLSMIKDEKLRLDTQRYLINDYLKLNQEKKLISIRNKLLGYDKLVASDFYTYFYEAFYHPFADGKPYQIYSFDTELANKMIRVCSMKLSDEEKAVCNYGMIGKNIALGQFEGLEDSLLKLATDYPQGYLYHALGEYYIQQGDTEKAKAYLLKAVSMTKRTVEVVQIKKLLQETM